MLESLSVVDDAATLEARLIEARAELQAIEVAVGDQAVHGAEAERLGKLEVTMTEDVDRLRSELDGRDGVLAERRRRWATDRNAFIEQHGSFTSTAGQAARLRSLVAAIEELAATLESMAVAGATRDAHRAALAGTMAEFGVDDPAGLEQWARTPDQVRAIQRQLDDRAEQRREVTARIDAYVAAKGPEIEPDVAPAAEEERRAAAAHDDLVGRAAEMAVRLGSLDAAIADLSEGSEAIAGALVAKEEADTLAALCAGLGQRTRVVPVVAQELGPRLLPPSGPGPCQPPAPHHDQWPVRHGPER